MSSNHLSLNAFQDAIYMTGNVPAAADYAFLANRFPCSLHVLSRQNVYATCMVVTLGSTYALSSHAHKLIIIIISLGAVFNNFLSFSIV